MKLKQPRIRAFSAVELTLVMVIGLMLTGFSLKLMISITNSSRSTEARGRMMDRSTAALDNLARELDYRLPPNLPGWDYSVEEYKGDSIKVLSTRRLENTGEVVLAEYLMVNPGDEAGKGEESLGTRLMLTEYRIIDGERIESKVIASYGPKVEANISFYYNLSAGEANQDEPTATYERPDTIKFKIMALTDLGGVASQSLVGYWRAEGID